MKKLIAFVLVIAVLFSFAACSGDTTNTDASTEAPTESTADTTTEAPTESTAASGDETPANLLKAAFLEAATSDATALDVATALSTNEILPFMAVADVVEPGYLNGFTTDITGFKSGAFFGPMISTIAFAGYVFELEDGADADAFAAMLEENSDLAWNICTQADEKVTAVSGNLVFFVMSPAAFQA